MIARLAPWIMAALIAGTVIVHLAHMDWIGRYENPDGGAAFAAYPPDQPIWAPPPTVTFSDFARGRTTEPLPREGGTLSIRINWEIWRVDLAAVLFIICAAYLPIHFLFLCDAPTRLGDFLAYGAMGFICSNLIVFAVGLFIPYTDPIEFMGGGLAISAVLAVATGTVIVCVKTARTRRWRATAT